VDPQLTTAQAHEVADQVEERIQAEFPQVVDVVVHVEPARSQAASGRGLG
jgi:divalent metal cation (Fe/Co/Zn/Cd) transporter